MKQTAVEFLEEQMMHPSIHNPYIEQAKEMEKKQIIDSFNEGQALNVRGKLIKGEQYYNETFNE
jgi:hypothetical protein